MAGEVTDALAKVAALPQNESSQGSELSDGVVAEHGGLIAFFPFDADADVG